MASTHLRILAVKIEESSEIRIKMSTGSIADSRALRQSLAKAATEKETSDDKVLFQKQAVKIKLPLGNQKHGTKEEEEGLLHKHPKKLKTQNVQKNKDKTTSSSKSVERVWNSENVKRRISLENLSLNQVLMTEILSHTRELEYWNNKLTEAFKKIADKEKELLKLDKAMKKAVVKEDLWKKSGDGQDISVLQKKIANHTEERDKARTNAAANSKLMEMMERNFDEASVKLDKFQKETLCRDKNCESTNLPRTAPISMTLQSS